MMPIREPEMAAYSQGRWINSFANYPYPKGVCGSIAAAALLAYLADHGHPEAVPPELRPAGSAGPGPLAAALISLIDQPAHFRGTTCFRVAAGLNAYSRRYLSGRYRFRWSLLTRHSVSQSLAEGCPALVGIMAFRRGNPYGFHWVLAYELFSQGGRRYYRAVDNHGSCRAAIPVSWTFGCVRLVSHGGADKPSGRR